MQCQVAKTATREEKVAVVRGKHGMLGIKSAHTALALLPVSVSCHTDAASWLFKELLRANRRRD
jgi:hypothetical protein